MKRMLWPLALLLATAPAVETAPAPVYKERPGLESAHRALPERLRYAIEHFHLHLPEIIERSRRNIAIVRSEKDKETSRRTMEHWMAEYYRYPIELLEYQRKQPPYQSREDQQKIETALKFYRIQYHEAKKKGLFTESPNKKPLK